MELDSHKQLVSLLCLPLVLLLFSGHMGLQAEARLQHHEMNHSPKTLFVFGDSYVDTGNTRKDQPGSWKNPYGITFPGKPAGRFSDGRVLTDFIAKYLGLKSPLPYKFRKLMPQHLKNGMNFAYGGTGVFDTSSKNPNMTIQIDFFKELIKENVYTTSDLSNSVALVSVAGNDYNFYLATNGSLEGFPSFIASVVNQTATNLLRIQRLGVRKIVVGGLQPLGCLPSTTATSSFQQCNSTFNDLVVLHNNLLNQAVTKLNQQTKDHSTFIVLDLYDSFMSVLNHPSTSNIKDQFKPCCVGLSSQYSCGSVDENNVKKYSVCDHPTSTFFWDLLHPTQAGWHAVYNKLQTTSALQQLRY
ncbi:GDSL esterase/lipase At5g03610 [Cajanus cajan]|uniref:GDSL esterase/lipase At5g03610 family n=1 Tax=Cajanus cajan TaxID=3821 RepID=A0A151QZV9_CAJCA|nr:GDSL esterase/lipase At5g03610 [Cajanus cajan]KYP35837.1 GDSL esterase/lipase At5g03610 family [Cajanus cajan]